MSPQLGLWCSQPWSSIVSSCRYDTVDSVGEAERGQATEAALAHHVLVCALHELGCLVQSLGTSSAPLITEPSSGMAFVCIQIPVADVLLTYHSHTFTTVSSLFVVEAQHPYSRIYCMEYHRGRSSS